MEHADSIVIDGHKMLMTPSIMTFLLFKQQQHSYSAFSQKAQYLLERSEQEEWYNLAHRTFECTKHMMSIKYYVLLKYYGEAVFDQFVTRLYDLGRQFAAKVTQRKHLELALDPESNIVCFRYIRSGLSHSGIKRTKQCYTKRYFRKRGILYRSDNIAGPGVFTGNAYESGNESGSDR